jgi:hypothetical protein
MQKQKKYDDRKTISKNHTFKKYNKNWIEVKEPTFWHETHNQTHFGEG